jgi:hypothetical protein
MTRDNAKRNKDLAYTERDVQDSNSAATASVTDLGDTSRDITDTADVSRASIAKGRGTIKNRTAADIAAGKINSDESIIQGITQDNINLERRQGQGQEQEQQQQRSNAQGKTSKKIVDSGTSLKKDKSIDRADIYSTGESGTRHIERAQEKPVKKKEDKEKGSWKIEEEKRSEND